MLRGLGVYHGKRGWGVSVEFEVKHGPVTTVGIAQLPRRRATGSSPRPARSCPGPLLQIGNTTSRVDFGCDPGEWTDAWSATGISHHWALGTGDLLPGTAAAPSCSAELSRASELAEVPLPTQPEEQAIVHGSTQRRQGSGAAAQQIELPSWAFGNSGTRFKVFAQQGRAAGPVREDRRRRPGARLHRVAAPAVARAHSVGQGRRLRRAGRGRHTRGIRLGTINANVFQDDDYKLGSVTNPDPVVRRPRRWPPARVRRRDGPRPAPRI